MTTTDLKVGQALPRLVKSPVTKTQLVMYSGASGDFNPIHTVDEFAEAAGLGGVIAHGMLTMAFVGQMLTDAIGEDGDLLNFSVRFKEMVRPGDVVTCEGTVVELQEEGATNVAVCDISAFTSPEKVVVTGTAEFRVSIT
ncbi:MaoC/PaaZ C-terminal domain-containing protein [Alicyclobacillus sp. SO9]|uniref:MaoC/PaaZ C-terminal domain-containing protein n=1 Tax=Alicyclobacillus sp. SO9 TaxID=2665646 RepID=UPI0018E6F95D|nr:MaoC/PaaZ C-terminal domain-containing protein [Alicyclobacillus sp. SO9]QQE77570.1 MaoC family dehydratase N-terminal domain-containing protein [Alicyclobacillus sp. SO9]